MALDNCLTLTFLTYLGQMAYALFIDQEDVFQKPKHKLSWNLIESGNKIY